MDIIEDSDEGRNVPKGSEVLIQTILKYVFEDTGQAASPPYKLNEVENYVAATMDYEAASSQHPSRAQDRTTKGRLGPKRVILDVGTNVGSLIIGKDRLGVASQSNFSTIRANVCVYAGRWQYELMLLTKGVMQVGWTTPDAAFSQEKGVGDTADSYAYDGSRIRKWNVATNAYGEAWSVGDVIGCTIDVDAGILGFYRNGRYLGDAFGDIRLGPGLAYFPAISLAFSEKLVANFGATPLRHPVDGFSPLQDPPLAEAAKAQQCLRWLKKILLWKYHGDVQLRYEDGISPKAVLVLAASHIFQHLGPLLTSPYIVDAVVLPFLLDLGEVNVQHLHSFLDLVWTVAEDLEIRTFLEHLANRVLSAYRFTPIFEEYAPQRRYLVFITSILEHRRTRHFLLQDVLFDILRFPEFLHVRPPDDALLDKMIPHVWWDGGHPQEGSCEGDLVDEEFLDVDEEEGSGKPLSMSDAKGLYAESVSRLRRTMEELERLQLKLLLVLLQEDVPNEKGVTTRAIFRVKFREFLKENMLGSRVSPVPLCPPLVSLGFFHCIVRALKSVWTAAEDGIPLHVPVTAFVDGTIDCFEHTGQDEGNHTLYQLEVRRLGGLASHLRKTLAEECSTAVAESRRAQQADDDVTRCHLQQNVSSGSPGTTASLSDDGDSALIEILDGTILLYHIAAHKQLGKTCALKDNLQEYANAFHFTRSKLKRRKSQPEYEIVRPALMQSAKVFAKKLQELGRQMALVQATIYSPDKRADVDWLLRVLLATLKMASQRDSLFAFVPDFYVESCINSCAALRSYFPPCPPPDNPEDFRLLLTDVATFLASHFADKRIVSADVKDNLIQALASFVCKATTLAALESISQENRISLVRKLLHPYENRAWAQSNWILVRFWKGCGFAFRYTRPPHLARRLGPKLRHVETSLPNQFYKPCPSLLFQQHVAEILLQDGEGATAFLNSVLNQLNWAFSEFVGMLQEIQNMSNSLERLYVDPRQLKICSTCFDLSVALLRVLEMVVSVAPALFTDWSRPAAEPLLTRLCQLICQVLNRVTSRSGCFDLVVGLEIPGLEAIDHFPLVTAVVGVLVLLLVDRENCPKSSQECATATLLAESSFQLSSLEFVLGLGRLPSVAIHGSSSASASPNRKPPQGPNSVQLYGARRTFSLKNYSEVSTTEINQVEKLLQYLWAQQAKISAETKVASEEDLCPICYAHPITATFQPCGHRSCRACISHQLMNKTECFFCKSNIEKVVNADGEILHDLRRKQTSV